MNRSGVSSTYFIYIKLCFVFLFGGLLLGCEARLNLDQIEKTLGSSIRRTDQLMSIQQLNDGTTFVLGNDGLVLSRKNSDAEWQRQTLSANGVHPNFIDASVCSDDVVAALAYENQLWVSRDKGEQWTPYPIPTQEDLQAIECTPSGDIWVVGSFSTLLVTKDQGGHWQTTSMDEDSMLTEVSFISQQVGFVVGEFGLLLKTSNGGKDWNSIGPISEDFYPLAAYFKNETHGWVGGLQGVILHTRDGGLSWERQQVDADVPVYNFLQNGTLYATGDRGTVLKYTSEGWRKLVTPDIPTYYRSGIVLDEDSLLLAGGWGVLLPIDLSSSTNPTHQ